jgi:hypothetical protein
MPINCTYSVVTTDSTTWTYTPLHCLNDVTVIQQSTIKVAYSQSTT